MVVISSRDFRSNQSKYLGIAASGQGVVLKTRSLGSFKIVPINEDDVLMTKEEFFRKVDEGRKQIAEGEYTSVKTKEELDTFLESL